MVLTKNGEMTICILPTKTRGCAPQSPKQTKMTKVAGVPQTKLALWKPQIGLDKNPIAKARFAISRQYRESFLVLLWYFNLMKVVASTGFAGAAPRRVSTGSG